MRPVKEPQTLQEAILYFSDPDRCIDYLALRRWPDGLPVCPVCGRKDAKFLATQRKWQCKTVHHHRQFSVKVGTIFEDSPIPLEKWLPAVWVIVNCKNGVSSYELARDLGVTQKSAWFMLHRIRLGMQIKAGSLKLGRNGDGGGGFEFDETFVGGSVRNMHKGRRLQINQERNKTHESNAKGRYNNKTPVFGIFDRDARKVRAQVVPVVRRDVLQAQILEQVEQGSRVYTDESMVYSGLSGKYVHEVVNHLQHYVNGQVHTNCLENFWSLLKRGLNGTYVSVEPFHLCRYVDEQVFRFNHRATKDNPMTDADRFSLALTQIAGKRLTYEELTGKDGTTPF
jgi:ISXO2-like transposase domain/Transposase zinc-ribbon domain